MKLDLSEFIIRQFINNGYEFFRGRQLAKEGKVVGVRLVDSDRVKFAGRVTEENGTEYLADTEFDIKGRPILGSCTCEKGVQCRHIAALLSELMSGKGESAGNLSANYVASKNFLNMLEKRRLDELKRLSAASGGKLGIEPVVHFERDQASVELFLVSGGKRKKRIDDIFVFAADIDRNTGREYREYSYNISAFDSKARDILNFIYNRAEIKAGFLSLESLSEDKSRFLLTGASLDSFFEMYKNGRVKACLDDESAYVIFEEARPFARVEAKAYEDKVKLKKGFSSSAVYISGRYGYILLGNRLYRTSGEYALVIRDIEAAFELNGGSGIVFEAADFSKLVDYCLPMLKRFDLLENAGEVYGKLNMIPFSPQIYIEEKGRGICGRVRFVYGDTIIDYSDKRAYREFRDDRAETVFKLVLEGMGFFDSGSEGFIMLGDEQIYDFFRYGITALGKSAEVYLGEGVKEIKRSADKIINIDVKYEGNLLDIDFDTDTINIDEMKEVLNAYSLKKQYYRFSDGRYISIENNRAFIKFLNSFDPSKKALKEGSLSVGPSRLMVFERLFDENDKSFISMDKRARELSKAFKKIDNSDYTVPPVYDSILRDYQKRGFRWLKALESCHLGGILADDMGLGKTIQVISLMYDMYMESEKAKKPSLVICPTSLIFNWENELETFGCGLGYEIVYGSRAVREEILKRDTQVFITSYEALRRDIDLYRDMEFEAVIADEAQFIKNRGTKLFSAVSEIKSDIRLALTGTPFENRLAELWSVFQFVLPGYLGSYRRFGNVFEKPIMKKNDTEKMKELKKLISPFILRREKGDVLRDLPEKTESCRYILMNDEQSKLYKAELLKARGMLTDPNDNEFNHIKILSEITKLRQICCHPAIFLEGYKGESGKLDFLLENIDSFLENGHKILIFSQFTSMLAIIKERLQLKGYALFYLDGTTPAEKRLEYVNSFNTDNSRRIFLVSLRAGGTGLNLTGADIVIHYDQWWNPAVMQQASDRAHRFGQIRRVQVYNLITKNTIEEKIIKLQNKKKQLFEDVMDMEGGMLGKMSAEEILELFS